MIHDALRQRAESMLAIGGGLLENFVLRNGQEFKRTEHVLKVGPVKECFSNATHFILNQNLGSPYLYCEGYAVRPSIGMLIHHAWVVDNNGNAYDLTWRNNEQCYYYGVTFDAETLEEQILANGVYGLLDTGMLNVDLMQRIDPYGTEMILRQAVENSEKWRLVHPVFRSSS